MTRVVAKISVYDILAMIVPGSIVLMGLGMIDCICDKVQDLYFVVYFGVEGHAFWTVTGTIFFLALSYITGIIIQAINVLLIKVVYSKWNYTFVNDYIKDKIDNRRPELDELTHEAKQIVDVEERKNAAMKAYYKAYNYAIIFNAHTAVLDLEKQIAMMRNFMIATLPMCIALMHPKCCCGITLWIVLFVALAFVMSRRMKKAVALVFEEYEAVKQLGLDEKNEKY